MFADRMGARANGFVLRSLLTTGTRLLDLPSRYGLHLLIAARLPVAEVGAFYIVFSVMTLASGFGRLGVDRALTREVAGAIGRGQAASARAAVRRAFVLTVLQSAAIAALLALAAPLLADHVLHKPALATLLMLGALTIVPQNISTAAAGALAGLGHVATSQMIYSWLWPAIFCVGALFLPLDVRRTLLLIAASLVLDALVGVALMLRVLPRREHAEAESRTVTPLRSLFSVGVSFFSLDLLQLSMASAPPFVLGIFATTTSVGRYALAWRIVLVLNLLVSAIAAMAAPQFARLHAAGDRRQMARVAVQSLGLALLLAGAPMLLLLWKPVFLLGLFGHGYAPAAPLLRILLLGQAALVLCTALPELLGMTGHARTLTRINTASLSVLVVLLVSLTPCFGAEGAAWSVSIALAINSVAITLAVRRDLDFVPLLTLGDPACDNYR